MPVRLGDAERREAGERLDRAAKALAEARGGVAEALNNDWATVAGALATVRDESFAIETRAEASDALDTLSAALKRWRDASEAALAAIAETGRLNLRPRQWYVVLGHLEEMEDEPYMVEAESPEDAVKDAEAAETAEEGKDGEEPRPYHVTAVLECGEVKPRIVADWGEWYGETREAEEEAEEAR